MIKISNKERWFQCDDEFYFLPADKDKAIRIRKKHGETFYSLGKLGFAYVLKELSTPDVREVDATLVPIEVKQLIVFLVTPK